LVSLTILRVHCAIISRVEIAILVLVLTLLYWYYSFQGVMNIDVRLDSEKILPKDSKLHEPNSLLTRYVWKEHLTPLVLVNTRFDLTDRNMTTQFWNVLKELETLPLCKGQPIDVLDVLGPASSLVWIREFANELNETGGFYPYETELDPTKLRTFLANDRRHLDRAIKFSDDSENATIESFVFLVSYTNVTNWDVRIKLMLEWRNVVGKYPELDMTVYESAGFFVDQMLSLRLVTTQTAIFTLASMTLLCAIFMGNLCGILTASASMASISLESGSFLEAELKIFTGVTEILTKCFFSSCPALLTAAVSIAERKQAPNIESTFTGVIGFMAKLGFDLDPVVMVSVLMTIGMSVDYVAHVAYHMQLDTKSTVHRGKVVRTPMRSIHEKLEHTVESVALPLAQAGISTVSCVLPLLLLPVSTIHTLFAVLLQ
uniref:SSD domain-containing protein n=1 Tax=Heligmosomoides polygyrus TaxID=6339 RepID=A0A183FPT3_HELPZ